jgi:predicted AAA+ superfamily ATPase
MRNGHASRPLRRRFSDIDYYRTANNLEADFLVGAGGKRMKLIQVADNLDNAKTRQREIAALAKAMDEMHLEQAVILTNDSEEDIVSDGKTITVRPVYRWRRGSSPWMCVSRVTRWPGLCHPPVTEIVES